MNRHSLDDVHFSLGLVTQSKAQCGGQERHLETPNEESTSNQFVPCERQCSPERPKLDSSDTQPISRDLLMSAPLATDLGFGNLQLSPRCAIWLESLRRSPSRTGKAVKNNVILKIYTFPLHFPFLVFFSTHIYVLYQSNCELRLKRVVENSLHPTRQSSEV